MIILLDRMASQRMSTTGFVAIVQVHNNKLFKSNAIYDLTADVLIRMNNKVRGYEHGNDGVQVFMGEHDIMKNHLSPFTTRKPYDKVRLTVCVS